jgi:hypothetical protein
MSVLWIEQGTADLITAAERRDDTNFVHSLAALLCQGVEGFRNDLWRQASDAEEDMPSGVPVRVGVRLHHASSSPLPGGFAHLLQV